MLKIGSKQVVLSAIMALTLLLGMCGCAGGSSETPNESDVSYPVIDQSDVSQTNNENTTTTMGTDSESSKDDATTSNDVSNTDSPITTTIASDDKVIDNGTNTTESSTTTNKDKTTTTKKPTTSTTKKPTTTTKKETTTTKDPYETIQLNVKVTYYGCVGYFTKEPDESKYDATILGFESGYSLGRAITEYYDVADDERIYFACDGRNMDVVEFGNNVREVGQYVTPVRTK